MFCASIITVSGRAGVRTIDAVVPNEFPWEISKECSQQELRRNDTH